VERRAARKKPVEEGDLPVIAGGAETLALLRPAKSKKVPARSDPPIQLCVAFEPLVKFFTKHACNAPPLITNCPSISFPAACRSLIFTSPEAPNTSRHGEYFSARE
jgi:hypothetical protein